MSINSKKRRDLKKRKKSDQPSQSAPKSCFDLVAESYTLLAQGDAGGALNVALTVAAGHKGHGAWEEACHVALDILLERYDANQALPLAVSVAQHNRACPRGLYQLARAVHISGKLTRALELYRTLLDSKFAETPGEEELGPAHVCFAAAAVAAGRAEELAARITTWSRLATVSQDSKYFWALINFEAGRFNEAENALEELSSLKSPGIEKAALLHELGICAQARGDLGKARALYLEAALTAVPSSMAVAPYSMLAVLEMEAGNPEQALVWARRALERGPDNIQARVNFAAALANAGQFKAAAEEYRIAVAALPDPKVKQSMAFALIEADEYDKAIEELKALIASGLDQPSLRVNLGVALLRRGQPGDLEEALALHQRAVGDVAGSQSATVHLNILGLLAKLGSLERALRYATALTTEGWTEEDRGRLQELLRAFEDEKKEYIFENLELIDNPQPPRYATGVSISINVQAGGIAHVALPGEDKKTNHQPIDTKGKCVQKQPEKTEEKPQGELAEYAPEKQEWFVKILPKIENRPREKLGDNVTSRINLVLVTVKDTEMNAALALMQPLAGEVAILRVRAGQETYHLGRFGSHDVALTMCMPGSIGRDASILATKHAIDTWRPKAVIMVGFAFGRDPGQQKIADVLVAEQIISYEPKREGDTEVPRGPIPVGSAVLLNRFRYNPDWEFLRPDGTKCEVRTGAILSGEKLVANKKTKAKYFKQYSQAIGGEMEGAGLWAAAERAKVDWILVKAICDWGDGNKHKRDQPLAAAAAVSLVHHVLLDEAALDGLIFRNAGDVGPAPVPVHSDSVNGSVAIVAELSNEQLDRLVPLLSDDLWPVRRDAYAKLREILKVASNPRVLELLKAQWTRNEKLLLPKDYAAIVEIWELTEHWGERDELVRIWQTQLSEDKDLWGRIFNYFNRLLYCAPESTLAWMKPVLADLLERKEERTARDLLLLVSYVSKGEFGKVSPEAWKIISSIYELFKDQEQTYSSVSVIRSALQ